MNASGRDRETVAVIGTGRVGTAMARLLPGRGYGLAAVFDTDRGAVSRAAELSGAPSAETAAGASAGADIVLITVPDGRIEEACLTVARTPGALAGKKVIHMSGALTLAALAPAAAAGADILVVHPLQTFADTEGATASLPGSTFGVTCAESLREWAEGFVSSLSGRALFIPDEDKALYHAAAAMACNLMVMVEYGAQVACRRLGIADEASTEALEPLVRATAGNVARLGPAGALTGPLARGDVETLEAHLEALDGCDPELARMYRAVSSWGLRLVEEKGEVDRRVVDAMRSVLG